MSLMIFRVNQKTHELTELLRKNTNWKSSRGVPKKVTNKSGSIGPFVLCQVAKLLSQVQHTLLFTFSFQSRNRVVAQNDLGSPKVIFPLVFYSQNVFRTNVSNLDPRKNIQKFTNCVLSEQAQMINSQGFICWFGPSAPGNSALDPQLFLYEKYKATVGFRH